MIFTEIIWDASELQTIIDTINEVIIRRPYHDGRTLSQEGQRLKEIADNLTKIHSKSSSYVIRRLESK